MESDGSRIGSGDFSDLNLESLSQEDICELLNRGLTLAPRMKTDVAYAHLGICVRGLLSYVDNPTVREDYRTKYLQHGYEIGRDFRRTGTDGVEAA